MFAVLKICAIIYTSSVKLKPYSSLSNVQYSASQVLNIVLVRYSLYITVYIKINNHYTYIYITLFVICVWFSAMLSMIYAIMESINIGTLWVIIPQIFINLISRVVL